MSATELWIKELHEAEANRLPLTDRQRSKILKDNLALADFLEDFFPRESWPALMDATGFHPDLTMEQLLALAHGNGIETYCLGSPFVVKEKDGSVIPYEVTPPADFDEALTHCSALRTALETAREEFSETPWPTDCHIRDLWGIIDAIAPGSALPTRRTFEDLRDIDVALMTLDEFIGLCGSHSEKVPLSPNDEALSKIAKTTHQKTDKSGTEKKYPRNLEVVELARRCKLERNKGKDTVAIARVITGEDSSDDKKAQNITKQLNQRFPHLLED